MLRTEPSCGKITISDMDWGLTQWKGRVEDNSGDDQTDHRVAIVLEAPGRKPNYKPGRDNPDIA